MDREEELIKELEEFKTKYINKYKLDEDFFIDSLDFEREAKLYIEDKFGDMHFDDYNIESYARGLINKNTDERCLYE